MSRAVCLSQFLKVIVKDARMTNQTHLFACRTGVGANHYSAPGANHVKLSPLVRICLNFDVSTQVICPHLVM